MEKISDLRIITVFYSKEQAEYFLVKNYASIQKFAIPLTIIDNGDNSVLLSSFNEIEYIKNDKNKGYGYSANRGIERAGERFILLMNDDITLSEEFLSNLLQNLSLYARNNYAIVGFRVLSKHSEKVGIHIITYNPFIILYHFSIIPFLLSLFSKKNGYIGSLESIHSRFSSKEVSGVNGSVMLLDRKKFNSLKGFDEEYFLTYEETDLFIRTLKRGMKIYYDSTLKAVHRHTLTSGNESLKYSFKSMMIFLRKHYGSFWQKFLYIWIYLFLSVKRIITFNKHGEEIEILKKSKEII
ncbi:MAG: hypothetical protein COX48_01915 [bacterium (Candidatus Stahlbacteria) CG23_combo_of_CG06-09_8_20_14_all_34_7]|nr:MAG: hypothetical protein COX48_01915 [bacterium (Candidatus Stahlbacteria) CG23_combo_of_CG06-09_8_20_14_all_34_7]